MILSDILLGEVIPKNPKLCSIYFHVKTILKLIIQKNWFEIRLYSTKLLLLFFDISFVYIFGLDFILCTFYFPIVSL